MTLYFTYPITELDDDGNEMTGTAEFLANNGGQAVLLSITIQPFRYTRRETAETAFGADVVAGWIDDAQAWLDADGWCELVQSEREGMADQAYDDWRPDRDHAEFNEGRAA